MIIDVKAVDYSGVHAYSRGSQPARVNTENVNYVILVPREQTRNVLDDISRIVFNDGTHLDVFALPGDIEL